ncbi:MAG: S6e family ribosomal protein [Candidatus Thermoplasmatota archaeon]|nr:S6e family ribosomal protein [Candidatus Thermoplasmatota archaeon]
MVNDNTTKFTRNTKNGKEKTYSPSYKTVIAGNNHAQLLGKKIGDVIDGIFVGEGESTLTGYKLEITGGSDKTGTPMRRDLDGGSRQAILVTASTGFKGHNLVSKTKKGEKKRFRYKPEGMRKRRVFRGNTITQDTRQINLKVVDAGNIGLDKLLGEEEAATE